MNWYKGCWKKYTDFTGRARREEFWMFVLFNTIIAFLLGCVDALLGLGFLGTVYSLAVFLPATAVTARRLHDTNRSGWWMLLAFLPVIGAIWLLVLLVLDSQPGPNRFGPNPKYI